MQTLVATYTLATLLAAEPQTLQPIDPTMGNYAGRWRDESGDSGEVTAKIIALGGTNYKGIFWAKEGAKERRFEFPLFGTRDDKTVSFGGKFNLADMTLLEWNGSSANDVFSGTYKAGKYSGSFELNRVNKVPENVGLKAPENAVKLFDGKNIDGWERLDGKPAHWQVVDGAMRVNRSTEDGKPIRGNLISKEKFVDHRVHIEFRTPFMPNAQGQARGNSGVYLQGRYEVQVLDSFGEPPRNNEAGGIYAVAAPKVNASLPPGEWQAYDITFFAPKFDDEGELTQPARISVVYNGVTIHENVELKTNTRAGRSDDPTKAGGLMLQDHGNPVEFRNIWVVPL